MSIVMNLYEEFSTLGELSLAFNVTLSFWYLLASLCYPVLFLMCLMSHFGLHLAARNKN